jgi:hypothetical protein
MAYNSSLIDTKEDFLLYKSTELERKREYFLEQYKKTHNPKTLELVNKLDRECNKYWNSVRLREFQKWQS